MTPIVQLLLVLGLPIAAAKLARVIGSKLGQPAVLGELPAGVLLGPSPVTLLGPGMISHGEVGPIVAAVGIAEGIITANIFAIMVIMVLVTTLAPLPLLRAAFARVESARAAAARQAGSVE